MAEDLGNAPPPNDPPADPPAGDPPPQAPARPEGIPDTLWGDSGFNADAFSQYRPPAQDLPANAEGYTLPTIDNVEIDGEDPLIGILRTRAFEAGMGQAQFGQIITDYASKLAEIDTAAREAAMQTIGDNAQGRIANVSTWLDGSLPAEEASALKALTSDPKAMLGLERLMNKNAQQAPRDPPPPPPTRKSHAEIRTLMQSKEYSGKAHERNPAVIEEVTKWWAEEERVKQAAAAAAAKGAGQ